MVDRRLGTVNVRLAGQVSGQTAVDGRAVGRGRHRRRGRRLRRDSIQYCTLQQRVLRVLSGVDEAFAQAAEHHPVAPCQLQLQLLHHQLEHPDLGVARLHHEAQRFGGVGLVFEVFGVVRHPITVPSGMHPGHPGHHRAEVIQ